MTEKDITEKALEAFNDVFADIINNLLFQGQKRILEQDLEQGRERSVYKGEKSLRNRNGTPPNTGKKVISASPISALKMKRKQNQTCRFESSGTTAPHIGTSLHM